MKIYRHFAGHRDGGVDVVVELGGRGRGAGRRGNLLELDQWQPLRYLPDDLPRALLAAAVEALVGGCRHPLARHAPLLHHRHLGQG